MKLVPTKETFQHISIGLIAIRQTSAGIKKAFKERLKDKNKQIRSAKVSAARLLDTKNKVDKEKLVEARSSSALAKVKKNPIASTVGGFWQRLMVVFGSLLSLWILDKLPKIIKAIEEFVERAKRIVDSVKRIFESIVGSISEIKDVFVQAWDNIKNLDFLDSEGKLRKELQEANQSLSDSKKTWDKEMSAIGKEIRNYGEKTHEHDENSDLENRDNEGVFRGVEGDSAGTGLNKQPDINPSGWSLEKIDNTKTPSKAFGSGGFKEIGVANRTRGGDRGQPLVIGDKQYNLGHNLKLAIMYAPNGDVQLKYKGLFGSTFNTPILMETINGKVVWHDDRMPHGVEPLTDAEKNSWLRIVKRSIDSYTGDALLSGEKPSTKEDTNESRTINSTSFFSTNKKVTAEQVGGGEGFVGGKVLLYLHGDPNRPDFDESGAHGNNWSGEAGYFLAHDHFTFDSRESAVRAYEALTNAGYIVKEFEGYGTVGKHSPTGGHFGPYGEPPTYKDTSDGTAFDVGWGQFGGKGDLSELEYKESRNIERIVREAMKAVPHKDQSLKKSDANLISSANLKVDIGVLNDEGEKIIVPMPINSSTPKGSSSSKVTIASNEGGNDTLGKIQNMRSYWT